MGPGADTISSHLVPTLRHASRRNGAGNDVKWTFFRAARELVSSQERTSARGKRLRSVPASGGVDGEVAAVELLA